MFVMLESVVSFFEFRLQVHNHLLLLGKAFFNAVVLLDLI